MEHVLKDVLEDLVRERSLRLGGARTRKRAAGSGLAVGGFGDFGTRQIQQGGGSVVVLGVCRRMAL